EIGPAIDMLARMTDLSRRIMGGQPGGGVDVQSAFDALARWFCILFGNQFTPDDVLDHYPADSFICDATVALLAVQTQTTDTLAAFPIPPAATMTAR
ncbi:MAG: hypothetical protein RR482_10050, partial [Clostridia bacterium]